MHAALVFPTRASMSSGSLSWPEGQERHENFPPLKEGDSITPLSSRPLTRIIPSDQKKSRRISGLRARYWARPGMSLVLEVRMIGVVFSKSSPGRYLKPSCRQFSDLSIHFME